MRLLIREHLGKFSTEFMLINIDSDQFQYIQNFTESHAHQYSSILVRNKVDDLEFTNYVAAESSNNHTVIDTSYILEISNIDKSTLLIQISELKQRLSLIPVINTAAIYSAEKLIWEVYNMEFTEKQKKIYEELCKQFDDIMVYNGDVELISSINAEYHFDPEDIIMTDGCIAPSIHPFFDGNNTLSGIENEIGIRGATYLIIYDIDRKKTMLRVDKPFIVEKRDAIIAARFQLSKTIDDMNYYTKDWRSTPLPNPCSVDDIYMK